MAKEELLQFLTFNRRRDMNFNTSNTNGLAWKKIVVLLMGVIFSICIFHEIMFWTFIHETRQLFNQFNTEFSQQQKEIQSVLDKSDRQFTERGKAFDAESARFSQAVEQNQKNMFDYIARMQKEQEEREKSFTQSFKAAPKKMWEEHAKISEEMQRNFVKESRK
jgi:predicted transposase YbfD/YdcC